MGWLRLWADYNAYGRNDATALPDVVTETTWDRFFHGHEPMEALVAEWAGRLVGFAHIVFQRSTSDAGPPCFLEDLFVEATLHGRGIGRALIEAVYARAKVAGAPCVYWHVRETNATAVRLYDKVASRSGHVVYRKDL
jgi:GNAT superfamily N-acetyltransferase